jgi:predicted oxidoreductase
VVILKSYKVPHTDLVVSRIAYGCGMVDIDWHSADFTARVKRVVNTAYDNGITFFDLGDVYGGGKSEAAFGEVLKQSLGLRDKIVIQSKCGLHFGNESRQRPRDLRVDSNREHVVRSLHVDSSCKHIINSAESSLRRMGTDQLDILLLHLPDALVEPEEVAQAFDELHRSGKVRHFGVSNHTVPRIELLKKYVRQPLVANQIQLGLAHSYAIWDFLQQDRRDSESPLDIQTFAGLIDYCRLHQIQVQAYSPLKGDVHRASNLLKSPADAAPENRRVAQELASLAKDKNTSLSAIALAWLLRHPAGIVPIIGTANPEHVIENCAADNIVLSREEWYALYFSAARKVD